MDQLQKEFLTREKSSSSINSFIYYMVVISFIALAAVFVGEIFFGKNSLQVYNNLKIERKTLQTKINKLKYENATLQKKYFELKSILPTQREEDE